MLHPLFYKSYHKVNLFPVIRLVKKTGLTVRTSVGLQSESDPSAGIPVQRNEAEETSDGWLLQLVLNNAVCITVTWKRLKTHNGKMLTQYLFYCCLTQKHM